MGEMSTYPLPTIPEYFSGKNIFITGATGFIGKVLVEKILRSCPDVGKIYMLIRSKRGKSPEERIKTMTDFPLYDLLKKEHPENLKKIVPVEGDIVDLDLGIHPEQRKILIEEVNIVYHIAASVRFDDHLKDAVIMNVRGTRDVAKLAKEMRHLEVFFHFSTTYANTDRKVIEEKIYPAHADWRQTIEVVEKSEPHILESLTQKYIKPLPNTYTFSKSLAEHVVNDLCNGQVPAVIMRPSIVISTMLEPVSGWIDNFNGPVGILVASGKGVMRTVYADPDTIADYVPCDILVKGVMIATWKKGTERENEKYKLTVYNGSSNKIRHVTIGEIVSLGKYLCWTQPLNDVFWYPNGCVTKYWYNNYLKLIFYQLLPALFVDGLLILLRKKPLLVRVHRKIFIANSALSYFLMNQWAFENTKSVSVEKLLLPSDQEAFSYQANHELSDPLKFFGMAITGVRRYLLNEPDSTVPKAKLHSKRMWLIAQVFNAAWYFIGVMLIYQIILKIDVASRIHNIYTYFNN